jgi:hypothetical protein
VSWGQSLISDKAQAEHESCRYIIFSTLQKLKFCSSYYSKEEKKGIASKPCSRKNSKKLIERFEWSTQLKLNIEITKVLEIRRKGGIMVRIKPVL